MNNPATDAEIAAAARAEELALETKRAAERIGGQIGASPTQATAHVFAGEPDARQSADIDHPTSRFRPTYRALTPGEKALHDAIKAKAMEMEALIEQSGGGRYRSLALTALEEAVIWSVKGLTT